MPENTFCIPCGCMKANDLFKTMKLSVDQSIALREAKHYHYCIVIVTFWCLCLIGTKRAYRNAACNLVVVARNAGVASDSFSFKDLSILSPGVRMPCHL